MALEHKLELRLSQKLVLTPQLQMAIKLLQMPQLELSQTLTQELVENPFLEEVVEDTKEELTREEVESMEVQEETDDAESPLERVMSAENLSRFTVDEYFEERSSDGRDLGYFTPGTDAPPSFEQFVNQSPDIYDHLLWQLRLSEVAEEIRQVGEVVIGNIDENGYLSATDEEIAKSFNTDVVMVVKAVELVQSFDPPGIGARDLKECLLLQLRLLGLTGSLAEKIILSDMEELRKKNYHQIARQHSAPLNDVLAAVKVIEGLEPKPARNFSGAGTNYVVPDVFIVKNDEGYQIILNDERLPRLRINSYYKKLLLQKSSFSKEERLFLDEKLRSATWLLKSLDQRNRTIYRVTESIINFQREFFDGNVQNLKPLNLRNVALDLGLHESTISRVTSNKYMSCGHGVFCFKFFFSSALQSQGNTEGVSSTSVKDLIKKIVSEEDTKKPLSDQIIVGMLKNSDVTIARRTVAKYREELKIPSQNQRRRFD
ncbi:MAG: RNA polymerase factor sigma-54 [Thermodesulfovibrionales bacterium]|nr:RNA polymerase factor sigma-54 [Thermodesulfovibrionales bacterium]MDP3112078.1 RNA polymerase factor sigma-54 [Thermodesulfovibrionales bacterium]